MSLPERLGKYRILEVLGSGAMGVVYRAVDPDIQREVAIKTLLRSAEGAVASGVSMAERFRNEAQAGGRLQHPGIVAVYDYGRDAGTAFIAMEYVAGHTLSRYLRQAAAGELAIADDDVLSIVGQLLEALHHAHEQGVWHRDIKPSNLIMTRQGKIKITDFGIARIQSAELTQVASLVGTPMYMAPEQFRGKAIDRRVDLYAAGVVLYQLLTGQLPFNGEPEALMYKVVHEPLTLPSRLAGLEHLRPYDAVLARALAKEPADRYADAIEFRDALVAVVGRMHNAAVSDATVTALLPPMPGVAPAPGGGTTSGPPPTHFSDTDLALAESSLARHLGPMARVLVRRGARETADLPSLYQWLAEHVTDAGARSALLQLRDRTLGSVATGSQPTGATGSQPTGARLATAFAPTQRLGPPTVAAGPPVSEGLREAAQRLLARHLGPIAAVVVKRAAAAEAQRTGFLARLAQAVDDPAARQQLIDALSKLPD
ncbi:serine/threonine-protein kinase [Ideonella sp. DXS22W]|uniref:Serine/threonine-protein kinase n=1 Tax=Pseudaquabacterium inlustre TaxID=2984192 RepID=A0ABU9CBV2_9BURK